MFVLVYETTHPSHRHVDTTQGGVWMRLSLSAPGVAGARAGALVVRRWKEAGAVRGMAGTGGCKGEHDHTTTMNCRLRNVATS